MRFNIGNATIYFIFSFLSFTLAVSVINEFSLENLVTVDSPADLKKYWEFVHDANLNEGRIILTPQINHISNDELNDYQLGSIWSTNSPVVKSFTTEMTLRSLGKYGLTGAGISFFFINEDFDKNDISNFGGPSIFNGLQILVYHDKRFGSVIKPFLNDGSKSINIDKDYLGVYKFEYQSSNVPFTIKLGYDGNSRLFKITCDNKLLFETNEITFSSLGNVKMGLSSKSVKSFEKHEQFEVLRLLTFDEMTGDLKEYNEETLPAQHWNDKSKSESKSTGKTFATKQQGLRDELVTKLSQGDSSLDAKLDKIMEMLDLTSSSNSNDALERKIDNLIQSIDTISSNFGKIDEQFSLINHKYTELTDSLYKQLNLLDNYDLTLRSFDKSLKNQLQNSNSLDSKLSSLSTNFNKKKNIITPEPANHYEQFKSLVLIVVLPLFGLLSLVIFWIQRLRNDIKHSKVL